VSDVAGVIKQLSSLVLPGTDRLLGSFDQSLRVTSLLGDNPPLGPFPSVFSLLSASVDWAVHTLKTRARGGLRGDGEGQRLIAALRAFVAQSQDRDLEQGDDYVVCHRDLHPGNILVGWTDRYVCCADI
jgi:hypothetical protein